MEWQQTIDTAVRNVTAAFSGGDKKLLAESLELAISNMGTDPAADQVFSFSSFFVNCNYVLPVSSK
jgi:hypothetical protein